MTLGEAADFDLEIDEEGVVRVLDHDPEEMMSFKVGDFNRFLTEFLCAVCSLEPNEEE